MKVGEAVLNKRSKVHKFALKICTVCHILFVVFLVVFFFWLDFLSGWTRSKQLFACANKPGTCVARDPRKNDQRVG